MNSPHILNSTIDKKELYNLFEQIASGNFILMLGAGASVTNKIYLSKQLIDYYEDGAGLNYNIDNVTKFLDVLEPTSSFNRNAFDDRVSEYLRKLEVSDHHKIIASISWKQILTTNYDLLLENAFDKVQNTSNYSNDLIPIRSLKEYNTIYEANNEVRYIKLNGCLSDKSKYPFVFSSHDFTTVKKYHRKVLQNLSNPSSKIGFLSVGYSYSDEFGYRFLEKFDENKSRERRWIFNLDPFVDEKMLPYFASKRIRIIKMSANDFFVEYKKWETENIIVVQQLKKKKLISTSKKGGAKLPLKLQYNLQYSLNQIDNNFDGVEISRKEFYSGSEPNYSVILKNFDVVRKEKILQLTDSILSIDETGPIIPIAFMTGSYGTGKSTFTYRLIHELLSSNEHSTIAFEIEDFDRLRKQDIIELINKLEDDKVIFHCNLIEKDSVFKAVLNLRTTLSANQFSKSILFLLSIRENILEKYQKERTINNAHTFNIDGNLNSEEISQLVENLRQCGYVKFRDHSERSAIEATIRSDYDSDQYTSLLHLVSNGSHIENLRQAYYELSEDCQNAFLYTALLHRYNILMPSSLLRSLISKNWDDFIENVVNVEGKGMLIQEFRTSKDLDPDLYFRTKHPMISELIVQDILKTTDKQFGSYKKILTLANGGDKNVRIVNDLLKAIRHSDSYYENQLNSLFDIAGKSLSEEPYFLLNYATNLQYRGTETNLKKAYDLLIYAESLFERQNHMFIHRRGVIRFSQAKIEFKKEDVLTKSISYLEDAKELLRVKYLKDPFSHYSYVDLIRALIWEIKNIDLDEEDELRIHIEIQDLFEVALNTVVDGLNRIVQIQVEYSEIIKDEDSDEYIDSLLQKYEDPRLRPYICVLLFKHFEKNEELTKCSELLAEMKGYLDIFEVLVFLFKKYSVDLHLVDVRMKYFELIKSNPVLKDRQTLRYHYYSYIAEAYNWNFKYAWQHLDGIKDKYNHVNPEYQRYWIDIDTNEPKVFKGRLFKDKFNYKFKSDDLPIRMKVEQKKSNGVLANGKDVSCRVKFLLYGISAEII